MTAASKHLTGLATVSLPDPAQMLFDAVAEAIPRILVAPMKDTEIATALDVSHAQVKTWLQRLVAAGVLEKTAEPVVYALKTPKQFE